MKRVCSNADCMWWAERGEKFLAEGWPDSYCPSCGMEVVSSGDVHEHEEEGLVNVRSDILDLCACVNEHGDRIHKLEAADQLERERFAEDVRQSGAALFNKKMGDAVIRVLRDEGPTRWTRRDFDKVANTVSTLCSKYYFVKLINTIGEVWLEG